VFRYPRHRTPAFFHRKKLIHHGGFRRQGGCVWNAEAFAPPPAREVVQEGQRTRQAIHAQVCPAPAGGTSPHPCPPVGSCGNRRVTFYLMYQQIGLTLPYRSRIVYLPFPNNCAIVFAVQAPFCLYIAHTPIPTPPFFREVQAPL
jgi:hypothetical protein